MPEALAGQTALVTGATSGIGLELATELARRGFHLVVVSRNAERVQAVATRLAKEHGIRADAIALDLSEPDAADRLMSELDDRDRQIDVLVNNAGFAQYGPFVENDPEVELRMLHLNIVALTRLTKLLLPDMVVRGTGRVLNVASTGAFMPGPLMAVYYATKAYVLSFSEALAEELRGSGVTVTVLCPGPTSTGFQARAGMQNSKLVKDRRIMDAATVARAGIDATIRGTPVLIPGGINRLQSLLPRLLPRFIVTRLVRSAQSPVT
jgi:uncharacterized protein